VKVSAALPTGMAALLFDTAARRRRLEGRMVARLEETGYTEVILPILDYLEPYEPFLTTASRGELYRFIDRDGELLTLRADFTPMLARVLAPRLPVLPRPLRLFYRGDVVRYREARAGRQREFYQVGAELLGASGEAADGEVLALFLELLALSPLRPVKVVLGFAGALDRLLLEAADPAALAEAIARRERGFTGPRREVLRQLVRAGRPEDPAALGEEAGERLARLCALRARLQEAFPQVELGIDLAEFAPQTRDDRLPRAVGMRGYYDGLLFRGFAGRRGLPMGSGGRYDDLFRRLGADLPAAGFSLDLEHLMNGSGPAGGDTAEAAP
jgi:ATP phosphoribosyltransferase regulatory subunit